MTYQNYTINLSKVQQADVSAMRKYFPHKYELHKINEMRSGTEGGEHYKLLNYLATEIFVNSQLLDVGARDGMSALALGLSRKNNIISYDILPLKYDFIGEYPNITFKQLDINKESNDILLNSAFISLDIDPHDGAQERIFIKKLKEINYKGILLLDDISTQSMCYFPEMKRLWQEIDLPKWDVTAFGHGSGTGIIDFSGQLKVIQE